MPDLKTEKKITAKKVIITSFVVDFSDVILSFVVTLLSGSVVMLTQVLEGASDLIASGLLLIGLRRSMKKEDKTHPFGYGREIYFWTLLAALVMFAITSSTSIYFGWKRFQNPEHVNNLNIALISLLITVATNGYAFFLSLRRLLRNRSLKHIARIFLRSSLIETKATFTLDLMGTLASLFGIVALAIYYFTNDARWDGIGAIAIGFMLAFFSIVLVLGIRDLLVGKSASAVTEEKIRKAALQLKEVEKVLDLKTLQIGPERLLVNLDVQMNDHLSTPQLEILIDKIKEKIRREVPYVKYVQVELDTPV